jgi:FAD/FMN-containing dehydrogenase
VTVSGTSMNYASLTAELVELLGDRGVSTDLSTRQRASVDGCRMSPILAAKLPLGVADIVAYPSTAEQLGAVVAAASRHGVPVTPRGKGTGNYGQGIPLNGGLVIDTSRARTIIEVGKGFITADSGAVIAQLENAAWSTGQQLLIYPSTAQSTIGGFLSGGSGGTGSIAHGTISGGPFVIAIDVAHATGESDLVHVSGGKVQSYLHNFGTAGVIARVTVALEPLQAWRAFYASFPAFPAAMAALRDLATVTPTPRLVSADPAELAASLPTDAAIPAGRASVRAILDESSIAEATHIVHAGGGTVEDVRDGAQAIMKMSMISYNHPIEWLQRAHPSTYFHVELGGDELIDRFDEVAAVYPGALLHLEAQRGRPVGMLAGMYDNERKVLAGLDALGKIGLSTHNPHQWSVDVGVERTRALKTVTDPQSLLNPGKLPAPRDDSGDSNSLMSTGQLS